VCLEASPVVLEQLGIAQPAVSQMLGGLVWKSCRPGDNLPSDGIDHITQSAAAVKSQIQNPKQIQNSKFKCSQPR
jgi:hypothetical protein